MVQHLSIPGEKRLPRTGENDCHHHPCRYAAQCEFTVDIRTNEFYTNEQLFELIKEKVHCEIKARSFRLSSTRTALDHPFVRRAILMGKEPFGSPTLSDQALMRFPSVKIGPGNSARSHSADEYIKGPEIREAIDTYVRLLNGLQL